MSEPAERTLNPSDLFSLRYVHDARLSPDARRVAYVISRTEEETSRELFELVVEELVSGTQCEVDVPRHATFPNWSPDGSRLAFIGKEEDGPPQVYITDVNGQVGVALTNDSHVQGPLAWSPDGSAIAFTVVSHQKCEGARRLTKKFFRTDEAGFSDGLSLHIDVVDVQSGVVRRLDLRSMVAMQPLFSPCGTRLLFLGTDAAVSYPGLGGLKVHIADLASGRIVEVVDDSWYVSAMAWSPCGKRIILAGDRNSGLTVPTLGLWVVDCDGSNAECRTEGFMGNVGLRAHHDMPTWDTSQNSHTLLVPTAAVAYATVARRGCTEIWRVALEGPLQCEPVACGPRTCLVMDVDVGDSKLLYCASDLHRPWELYLLDMRQAAETRITYLNDDVISGWPTLRMEHLTFEGFDGMPLEGWYLARGDREGPQPTVMFIHGGPYIATGYVFRFDFHLLAANGFAVLFANFRGSAGYGEPFARAIMGDWGGRGFPDHMAVADAAVARGLADPRYLGVWGASHGGFATAWIVGHTTRFQAAVVESATTNWLTKYYLSDTTAWIIKELGGRPDEIPDVYRSRSPLTYAWRCRTPTLLLHGEEDMRCPIAEAEQFYRALHDAGCVTELVRIPGMAHMGDSTGPLSARRAQNEALLDWFERHLTKPMLERLGSDVIDGKRNRDDTSLSALGTAPTSLRQP